MFGGSIGHWMSSVSSRTCKGIAGLVLERVRHAEFGGGVTDWQNNWMGSSKAWRRIGCNHVC
jgi:hypothetical protein